MLEFASLINVYAKYKLNTKLFKNQLKNVAVTIVMLVIQCACT